MENIVKYANSHQNNQLAILSASEVGIDVLKNMQERLHFAGDELLRMEDEGGTPLNEKQTAKVNTYFNVTQRIKKLLLIAQLMFPKI